MTAGGKCYFGENAILVGNTLKLEIDGASRVFQMEKAWPDPAAKPGRGDK